MTTLVLKKNRGNKRLCYRYVREELLLTSCILSFPLAMWYQSKEVPRRGQHNANPAFSHLVVLVCISGYYIPERIKGFYKKANGNNWHRLKSCASRLYPDLLAHFYNWDQRCQLERNELRECAKVFIPLKRMSGN